MLAVQKHGGWQDRQDLGVGHRQARGGRPHQHTKRAREEEAFDSDETASASDDSEADAPRVRAADDVVKRARRALFSPESPLGILVDSALCETCDGSRTRARVAQAIVG